MRSIRRSRLLKRITALIGKTPNQQCLEISAGDGIISTRLRELGGSWRTVVARKEAAEAINYCLSEAITTLDAETLPFEDNTFDRVVIVDSLKEFNNDYDFLHECHRILKNDGWVIVSETRRSPLSSVAILQRILGLLPTKQGAARNGYKVNELFNNLKDGFDVPETIVYSNVFFECACTIGDFIQKLITPDKYWMVPREVREDELFRYRTLNSLASLSYPLLWLLSLAEFLPGHKILVKSRRRHWRPRLQPKLIDGRSIAEAAINTKIGTAAPF